MALVAQEAERVAARAAVCNSRSFRTCCQACCNRLVVRIQRVGDSFAREKGEPSQDIGELSLVAVEGIQREIPSPEGSPGLRRVEGYSG